MNLLQRNGVVDAAMAAEAEIGHHIFAQEAYTTQTMLYEVQKQKSDFNDFINNMIALLKLSLNVLHLKQSSFRSRFSRARLATFLGSTMVALITGFRVMYAAFREDTADLSNVGALTATTTTTTTAALLTTTTAIAAEAAEAAEAVGYAADFLTPGEVLAFDLTIFLLSTAVSAVSYIALSRGWQKKSDEMAEVSFKVQVVKSSLPEAQLQLKFINTPEEMHLLRTSFMTREFKSFSDAVRSMDDHLSFETLAQHLPDQYALNVRYLEDDNQYQQKLLEIYINQQERLDAMASRASRRATTEEAISP